MDDEVDPAPAEGKEEMGEAGVGGGEDVIIDNCRSWVCLSCCELRSHSFEGETIAKIGWLRAYKSTGW